MYNLAIDRGNTRIKTGLFKDGTLIDFKSFNSPHGVQIYIDELKPKIQAGILASTGSDLELNTPFVLHNASKFIPPFSLEYSTPKTLGIDRIALTTSAYNHFPKQDCLIIGMGTCITYDFLQANGVYLGGAISPGLEMRFKSMQHFTHKLPLEKLNEKIPVHIGNSTSSSLQSGVYYGILHEIEGNITAYQKKYTNLNVILTGGDAQRFADISKNGIFAPPEFLLEGLYYLLEYNAERL